MNIRKKPLGERNIIGQRVTQARDRNSMLQKDLLAQLQVYGVDISLPALSLLEGQKRPASDIELKAFCAIFQLSADWFLGNM